MVTLLRSLGPKGLSYTTKILIIHKFSLFPVCFLLLYHIFTALWDVLLLVTFDTPTQKPVLWCQYFIYKNTHNVCCFYRKIISLLKLSLRPLVEQLCSKTTLFVAFVNLFVFWFVFYMFGPKSDTYVIMNRCYFKYLLTFQKISGRTPKISGRNTRKFTDPKIQK